MDDGQRGRGRAQNQGRGGGVGAEGRPRRRHALRAAGEDVEQRLDGQGQRAQRVGHVALAHLRLDLGQGQHRAEGREQVLLVHLRQRLGVEQAGLDGAHSCTRVVDAAETIEVVDRHRTGRHQAGAHARLVALEAHGVQAALVHVHPSGPAVRLVGDLEHAGDLLLRERLQLGHHVVVERRPHRVGGRVGPVRVLLVPSEADRHVVGSLPQRSRWSGTPISWIGHLRGTGVVDGSHHESRLPRAARLRLLAVDPADPRVAVVAGDGGRSLGRLGSVRDADDVLGEDLEDLLGRGQPPLVVAHVEVAADGALGAVGHQHRDGAPRADVLGHVDALPGREREGEGQGSRRSADSPGAGRSTCPRARGRVTRPPRRRSRCPRSAVAGGPGSCGSCRTGPTRRSG